LLLQLIDLLSSCAWHRHAALSPDHDRTEPQRSQASGRAVGTAKAGIAAALVEKSVGGAENTVGRRLTYAQTLAKRNPQLCGIAVGFLLGVGK
jgi:hypothetical protein